MFSLHDTDSPELKREPLVEVRKDSLLQTFAKPPMFKINIPSALKQVLSPLKESTNSLYERETSVKKPKLNLPFGSSTKVLSPFKELDYTQTLAVAGFEDIAVLPYTNSSPSKLVQMRCFSAANSNSSNFSRDV